MRRSRPRLVLNLVWLFAGLTCTTRTAHGDNASPSDPPALQALAASLVAASDDAARNRLLAKAPPVLRSHPRLGQALNTAWQPIIFTGDFARAEKLGEYTRLLMLGRGNEVEAAWALFWLGFIDSSRGDNQVALGKMIEAQGVFERAGDQDKFARALAGEGKVFLQLGDFQQALAVTRHALEIYRAIDGKEGIINTLNTSGSIFMAQGMTDRAMDYRRQALAVAGDDVGWQVYLFHNIANVYTRRGERDKATEWMSKSIAAAEKVGDRPNLAAGLMELGGIHQQNGQLDMAEDELRRALKIFEETGEKRRQAGTLSSLGDVLRHRGDEKSRHEALGLVERAAGLARETGEPADVWRSNTLLGQIFLALREPDRAREAFEESINAIEDTRGHLAADDEGATAFLEDKMDAYYGLVTLLVQQDHPAEALAMAERAKARVLVDILASRKFDLAQAMTDAERATAKRSSEEVASLNRQIAAARSTDASTRPTLLADLNAKLAVARRTREDAEADFFIAHPKLRNRRPPSANGALPNAALGSLLVDGKTTVLEYVVADDATFLFTIMNAPGNVPNSAPVIQAQRLPLDRTRLYARTQEFRTAMAERSMRWQTSARALGNDLLGPVRELCENSERLIIVADGPLWELPFQALILDEEGPASRPLRTLWQACAVNFAPSLTFLAQTPTAAPLAQRARLLAVGNPALDPALTNEKTSAGLTIGPNEPQPMPDAERQVQALTTLYGSDRSDALIGREAHEDAFKERASGYDVLHFATHGFLNDDAPMYSSLLMAQTDLAPDEDGFLEAWEWLPLRLHARLAVLAACESGRGKVGAGEGVLGLSWALFGAGCPAVIVSQWNVDSASTTELMIAFHRHLLAGEPVARSLRDAGLELMKNPLYQNPFYWAAFVMIGTDQAIVNRHL